VKVAALSSSITKKVDNDGVLLLQLKGQRSTDCHSNVRANNPRSQKYTAFWISHVMSGRFASSGTVDLSEDPSHLYSEGDAPDYERPTGPQ
jgi:hypothetical protein